MIERLCVIGVGLIGGSLARALRDAGACREVVGAGRNPANLQTAVELGVIDRIGGGDGFATGLIFGFLDGRSLDETLRLGWAHGALLTSFPGDTTMARLPEVEAFASGGSARVQR